MMSWALSGLHGIRAEFVMIARDPDVYMTSACRQFGISRKTGYKWLRRYETSGMIGLEDRSRRPRTNPLQVSGEVVVALVQLHEKHTSWGPKKLRARLSRTGDYSGQLPSLATVARLARRLGWSEPKGRGRPRRAALPESLSGAAQPNDVWTVDFKGSWRTGDGRRCEPLTIRDLYSRYILCLRPVTRCRTKEIMDIFTEVFEHYGLPEVIRSDNGGPFASMTGPCGLTRLSAWWRSLGIKLERIAPGHPEQNGGHERMHADIAHDIEDRPAATLAEEALRLERWRIEFNVERPHEALGMKTPGEVYRRSSRHLADVRPYVYPANLRQRHVRRDGYILIRGRSVYLSQALGRRTVGLEQLSEVSWRAWYCDLPVIEITLADDRVLRQPADLSESAASHNCNPCPDNKVLPMSRS